MPPIVVKIDVYSFNLVATIPKSHFEMQNLLLYNKYQLRPLLNSVIMRFLY